MTPVPEVGISANIERSSSTACIAMGDTVASIKYTVVVAESAAKGPSSVRTINAERATVVIVVVMAYVSTANAKRDAMNVVARNFAKSIRNRNLAAANAGLTAVKNMVSARTVA